jgi:hypothetical protein
MTCLVSIVMFWIGFRRIRSVTSNEESKRVLYNYYRNLKLKKMKNKS